MAISNHEASFMIDGIEFLVSQRNVGFASNDGRWIVRQCADLHYDLQRAGGLYRRHHGQYLGDHATYEQAPGGRTGPVRTSGPSGGRFFFWPGLDT
jgi:hypothetical protein